MKHLEYDSFVACRKATFNVDSIYIDRRKTLGEGVASTSSCSLPVGCLVVSEASQYIPTLPTLWM